MKPDIAELKLIDREVRDAFRAARDAATKVTTGRERPKDEPPLCSFCGAGRNNVRVMIPNALVDPTAYICDECVDAAQGVVQDN